jgi:hypothetical protein
MVSFALIVLNFSKDKKEFTGNWVADYAYGQLIPGNEIKERSNK